MPSCLLGHALPFGVRMTFARFEVGGLDEVGFSPVCDVVGPRRGTA